MSFVLNRTLAPVVSVSVDEIHRVLQWIVHFSLASIVATSCHPFYQ